MKNGICYVVGAGRFYDDKIFPESGDFVIAADGGYAYLKDMQIDPDLVLGDFDSLACPYGLNHLLKYPTEKDDTDMLLAVKYGLNLGYQIFVLYGGTGGRIDHTLANIQILSMLSQNHATGYLVGKQNIVTVISNGSIAFPTTNNSAFPWLVKQKGYISILSYSNHAKNVTIEGLRYTLDNTTLTNDYPIGVSNEFTGAPAFVSVQEGSLLITWEK